MNESRKIMVAALCVVACVAANVFAEEDFGIETASQAKIADPANPQSGAMFYAYRLPKPMTSDGLRESVAKLPTQSAVNTSVDKSTTNFSIAQIGKSDAGVGRWEGFLKCKRDDTYTFVLKKPKLPMKSRAGYSFSVNGKSVIPSGSGELSCDAKLKAGWNKIDLVCQFGDKNRVPLTMTFKPKDSTSEPRAITPCDLFHDQKPEAAW